MVFINNLSWHGSLTLTLLNWQMPYFIRKKERKKEHIFSDFHRVVNQLLGVVFLYLLNAFASISTFSYQNESKNGEKAYFEQGTRCATHIGWSKYTTRKD